MDSFDNYVPPSPGSILTEPLEKNHATIILILGLFSLVLCGPMGIIPWLLANSDLKQINKGRMSDDKIGFIKLGRLGGVAGVILFFGMVAFGLVVAKNEIARFPELFQTNPLPADKSAYVGEWIGSNGSSILITQEGGGSFKTRRKSVEGGKVSITDAHLTIGILGLSKTWSIQAAPMLQDGEWVMKLDDEIFRRKSYDIRVLDGGFAVRAFVHRRFSFTVSKKLLMDSHSLNLHPCAGRGYKYYLLRLSIQIAILNSVPPPQQTVIPT